MTEIISITELRKLTRHGKVRIKGKGISGLQRIRNVLQELKTPFIEEYRFDGERRFRFDFANLNLKLAIEYEGTASNKSRHTTLTGYARDCTKYNLAVIQGWRILRYSALNVADLKEDLKKIIQ